MKILLLLLTLFLHGCFSDDDALDFEQSVQLGKKVFAANCMLCHGRAGRGSVKDWRKPLANGKYPPPPLNGSAHTWHHSPKVLLRTINNGSIALGGAMPGFKNKLNNKEKQALLDYMYRLWPKSIQKRYDKRFKR